MSDAVPGGLAGLRFWLDLCLSGEAFRLKKFNNLRDSSGREVWEVTAFTGGVSRDLVLTIFKEADPKTINTNLPSALAARKCYLCCAELPPHGVPTPRAVGWAESGSMAVLLTEKVFAAPWSPSVSRTAAAHLARLHMLDERVLSAELQALIAESDPREERTTGGRGPKGGKPVLVHGDFFSSNILAARDGIRIVDWETFGKGDAMWDLGTLIGADPELPDSEVEAVIAAYGGIAPMNRDALLWHRDNWMRFFSERARS